MSEFDPRAAEIYELHCRVGRNFERWFPDWDYETKYYPNKVIGFTGASDLRPEHVETLRMLDGPHGYAIYKALLARKGLP